MRLVDADALKENAYDSGGWKDAEAGYHQMVVDIEDIDEAPTVDAVPVKGVEQIKWERDTAIQQLEEHGIPFCGKADVVAVVRCKDCRWYDKVDWCNKLRISGVKAVEEYWFCADGERLEG